MVLEYTLPSYSDSDDDTVEMIIDFGTASSFVSYSDGIVKIAPLASAINGTYLIIIQIEDPSEAYT